MKRRKSLRKHKVQAERFHAKRRAHERYGLDLNRFDLSDIVRRIQDGDAMFIERQSLRVTVWVVEVAGKRCKVVYDTHRKSLITFLPYEEHGEVTA